MREAVSVIAEMRDSDRLRKFLETGSDRALSFLRRALERGTYVRLQLERRCLLRAKIGREALTSSEIRVI